MDIFPYEIKRLIYSHTNLTTIKSLRQVSKSWSAAGLDFLLLPTFCIKSSLDVQRLLSIGTSPVVSNHASKTVKCLIFQSHGWDPRYFRNIVCNRHELRQDYQALDFVPTQAEHAALDELDAVIKQRDLDAEQDEDQDILISALKQVPRADSIKFVCQNPFTHQILRKSWEEYTLEAFQSPESQKLQLARILATAKEAGIIIRHLTHERLLSSLLAVPLDTPSILFTLRNLHSLDLVISDLPASLSSEDDPASSHLRDVIFACPSLKSLSLTFEVLGTVPMSFLEPVSSLSNGMQTSTLHSLTLSGVSIIPDSFFKYLSTHQPTLRRLGLRMIALPPNTQSFRSFLEDLRDRFASPDSIHTASTLEKFQLTGMIRSLDHEEETWLFSPCYDDEWQACKEVPRNRRTKEVEDFVIRGGGWPMVEADRLDIVLS